MDKMSIKKRQKERQMDLYTFWTTESLVGNTFIGNENNATETDNQVLFCPCKIKEKYLLSSDRYS